MFLFEGGSEASGAGVAMEAKWPRRVDGRVPVRGDEYRWCREFRENGTNGILHYVGEIERNALFLEGPLSGGYGGPCWAGTCGSS